MANFKGASLVATLFLVLLPNVSVSQRLQGGTGESLIQLNKSMLTVATVLESPYAMLSENGEIKGFVPDILDELRQYTGATFKVQKSSDSRHGAFDARTKTWSGIIRDLLDEKADIGFAALTITAEREGVIDFTLPFMEADLTIIYKSESKEPVAFGWLLSSISWPLWFALIACYAAVSVVLYVIGRISPYQRKVENEQELSLSNSFWVNASSVFLRSPDVPVVALSTRLLVGAWWFFSLGVVLILIVLEVSMFTSGAAFMSTAPNFFAPSGSINVGVVKGGSSSRLLQTRQDLAPILRSVQAAGAMGYASTSGEGVLNVLNGELDGFVMESPTAEEAKAKYCNLQTIPESLDKRSFAIAVPEGSALRDALSIGLMKLRENGKLDSIKNRWWPKDRCGDYENNYVSSASVGTYSMLFVVLFITMIIALLVAFAERFIHKQDAADKKIPS